MAVDSCTSCKTLNKQCLELRDEIKTLTLRLDNIIEYVSREYHDMSCQTDPKTAVESFCQTNKLSMAHISCQTDFISQTGIDSETSPKSQSPCNFMPNQPFSHFDYDQLDNEIVFDKDLNNRSVCYFGSFPYSYGSITHQARPLPNSECYLSCILQHVSTVLPDYEFNSVLITKYKNGSDFIGFHSDNEPEIVPTSKILTLSFGGTRLIEFKSTENFGPHQAVFVHHGDAFSMTRKSQNSFQHSIPVDDSIEPRISITLRLVQTIKPLTIDNTPSYPTSMVPTIPTSESSRQPLHTVSNPTTCPDADSSYSVYISDSMLRGVDASKMSSPTQTAIVLTYPGATAGGIINRLRNDPAFNNLDKLKVRQFYVNCGTNYVDGILGIPRSEQASFIPGDCQTSDLLLDQAKSEFQKLLNFLHSWSVGATINVLNILPRESFTRNEVINKLNQHISFLCDQYNYAEMIGTEFNRNLFSYRDGNRKNRYFSKKGQDNVHLNKDGIVRIAKHLKYIAHN